MLQRMKTEETGKEKESGTCIHLRRRVSWDHNNEGEISSAEPYEPGLP
jgi:hypothetical protein